VYWVALDLYVVLLITWSEVIVEVGLGCWPLVILKRTSYRLKVLTTRSSLGTTVFHRLPFPLLFNSGSTILRPVFCSLDFLTFLCKMSFHTTCFSLHSSDVSKDNLLLVYGVDPFEVESSLLICETCIYLQASAWDCSAMFRLDDYLFDLNSHG